MESRRRPTRLSVVFPLVLLSVFAAASLGGSTVAQGAEGPDLAKLLVTFDAAVSPPARAEALARVGAKHVGTISALDVEVVGVPAATASSASAALRAHHGVLSVEPDSSFEPQDFMPSDPSFPTGMAIAGGAWGWTKTRTTQAWEATRGEPSVVVAILDTGLKTTGLADFDGQVVPGWNVLKGSSDTSSSAGNHGTYVAGVVGLAVDNGMGNAGYCPGCRVMPVQIGTDSGASLSNMATGITWAVDHGARVLNLSWAGTSSSTVLSSAVSYARSKGAVVVAAAGNSNCDCITYPSATPGVLGVAGTTASDAKQGDSNFGSWVALAAPEDNLTAWPTINGLPGYGPVGGTSMAAPVVAGIAGLLFSARPSLTGAEVEEALEASAVAVPVAVEYGRVDALSALAHIGVVPSQPSGAPQNRIAPSVQVQTNGQYNYVPLDRAPQPGDVLVRGQGSWSGAAPLSLGAVSWQRCDAAGLSCATVASTARYTVQAADSGSTIRLTVTVKNAIGATIASAALSAPVGGSVAVVAPPANTSLPVISGTAEEGQILTASVGTWSGAPTSYGVQWRLCDSAGGACADISGASSLTYPAQPSDVGKTLRVWVTASNTGGSASASSAATPVVLSLPAPPPVPSSQTFSFSGTLAGKSLVRSFSVSMGAGSAEARLSFSKCASLRLTLRRSDGSVVASATGPSALGMLAAVASGTYTYEVDGGSKCSFALSVTAPTP